MTNLAHYPWFYTGEIATQSYDCGYCGRRVASAVGCIKLAPGTIQPPSPPKQPLGFVCICPACCQPTFIEGELQVPGIAYGRPVGHLPEGLNELYDQARNCMAVNAFIPAVMAARTILMHLAVDQGAAVGLRFVEYVDYLVDNGFAPPKSKPWINHIRLKGNDAAHTIALMTRDDAEQVLRFVEMALLFVYEYPASV